MSLLHPPGDIAIRRVGWLVGSLVNIRPTAGDRAAVQAGDQHRTGDAGAQLRFLPYKRFY